MVRKSKVRLKIIGFKASTVAGQKGFDPLYARSTQSKMEKSFLRGLHQYIEAWMVDHPRERIPGSEIAAKFEVSVNSVNTIARKIKTHHNLSSRPRGGSNFVLPDNVYKVIERIYANAKKDDHIVILNAIKEVARETKLAVTPVAIVRVIKNLEQNAPKKQKKSLVLIRKGLKNLQLDGIINLLECEGIEAKRFRPKPFRNP